MLSRTPACIFVHRLNRVFCNNYTAATVEFLNYTITCFIWFYDFFTWAKKKCIHNLKHLKNTLHACHYVCSNQCKIFFNAHFYNYSASFSIKATKTDACTAANYDIKNQLPTLFHASPTAPRIHRSSKHSNRAANDASVNWLTKMHLINKLQRTILSICDIYLVIQLHAPRWHLFCCAYTPGPIP